MREVCLLTNSDVGFHPLSHVSGASGSCAANVYLDGNFIRNVTVGPIVTGAFSSILTVGAGHGIEYQNFSCSTGAHGFTTGAIYTDAAGSHNLANMNAVGVNLFNVN